MAMRAHRINPPTPDASMDTPDAAEIDLSTFPTGDGKPVAETYANYLQMTYLQFALRRLLQSQGRPPAVIGGNQFLYYNPYNKREHLSPDVYVGFDLAPPTTRDVWFTWEEGKAPDIVFEITSPSTQRTDVSAGPRGKLTLYAQLGVREYYVYDPQLVMFPWLRAFALIEGRLEEATLLPNGGAWSELLRAELRAVTSTEWERPGTYLRVIDPTTGAPIRVGKEELEDARRAARARITAMEEQLTESELERMVAEQKREIAEEGRLAAEEGRLVAEARARHAEEELERLRSGQAPAGE